jgi:hypothetical protein
MNRLKSHNRESAKEWVRHLDRLAGDLNVLLLVFAIGLATVDATFFFTQKVIDHLPQVTRVVHVEQPAPAK